MRPKGKISLNWSPNLSYAIGLLASDGCLYNDGRHLSLTTKDRDQAQNFIHSLNLSVKIGKKGHGHSKDKDYFHVQFGDVLFYRFLLAIGLTPAKSRTIGELAIPPEFFFHFLRGVFDGDGCSYSYWDPRWRSSFMLYTAFASASLPFLVWLQRETKKQLNITGHITKSRQTKKRNTCYQLKYAKKESIKLIQRMYGNGGYCLKRKKLKIQKTLAIVGLAIV